MTTLEQQYAQCTGAYLEFFDGHRNDMIPDGIGTVRGGDVKFMAFLTEFSQNYSLTYDQEEVIGRNDPIMTYRSTARTLSLAWDVPSSDLFDAKVNKIKIRMLMRLMYPEYRNDYAVYDRTQLTKTEEQKIQQARRQISDAGILIKAAQTVDQNDGTTTSFQRYLAYKARTLFEDRRGSRTEILKTAQGDPYYRFSGMKHNQTMIKNPIIGIKYANLINSSLKYPDEPLLGWIDNLSITPNLEAGFFVQKPGLLGSLFTPAQLKNISTKEKIAFGKYEEGGSFPKVYSLSCNFNVIHDKPMGFKPMGFKGNIGDTQIY